jgi:hypothetical protein
MIAFIKRQSSSSKLKKYTFVEEESWFSGATNSRWVFWDTEFSSLFFATFGAKGAPKHATKWCANRNFGTP